MNARERAWLLRDKYGGIANPVLLTEDAHRLAAGEPIDYVVGWKEFGGVKIDLSHKPLIPREETEYWVQKIIKDIKKVKNPKVLDLCAGSGAIGLAVLAAHPHARATFTDVSASALKQIKKNIALNTQFKNRATVIKSNLFKNISGTFDFILSNPPYIPTARLKRLPKSVRNFEPVFALDGGADGLSFIQKILAGAGGYLKPNGTLVIEHDPGQRAALKKLAKRHNFSLTTHPDQFNRSRYSLLTRYQ